MDFRKKITFVVKVTEFGRSESADQAQQNGN